MANCLLLRKMQFENKEIFLVAFKKAVLVVRFWRERFLFGGGVFGTL